MDAFYFDFPLPPKLPDQLDQNSTGEDMATTKHQQAFQEPLLFGDDVFDIVNGTGSLPEEYSQFQNFPEQFYWMGPAPQPPPKHPGRAKRYSALFQRKTRRSMSVSSSRSDDETPAVPLRRTSTRTPNNGEPEELPLSPVPSFGYSSSSSVSSIGDDIPTPGSTTSGYWTAEEKDFFSFTGAVTQRSRAASRCSERKPSLSIPAAAAPKPEEIESPVLPRGLPPIVFPTPAATPETPARQKSVSSSRRTTPRRNSSTRSKAPSVASNEDSTFRVDAIVISPKASASPPRQLRRRPAIPSHINLRQLRAEQSEACLKEAYARHVDAYLDGTIALRAFGI